jgi:dihydroflavonol-4-reductase
VECLRGNFADAATLRRALRGCDSVIHTGAYYPVYSLRRAEQARQALSELRAVLSGAAGAGIGAFIFTSSPIVLVGNEDAFRASTYHHIKRRLHEEVLGWIGKGFPGIVVIPGACFGPGDLKPTTGRAILEIANGRLPFTIDGVMNAVDMRDAARAYVNILLNHAAGPVYQLGCWNCTMEEFASEVARIAGVPAPPYRPAYRPLRTAAAALEWVQYHLGADAPLLPCSGLDQVHYGAHLDSSLAIRELGFTTRPMSATIGDTLRYFHAMGRLRSGPAHRAPMAWREAGAGVRPEGSSAR